MNTGVLLPTELIGSKRKLLFCFLLFLAPAPVTGSFECLPGPAPGGVSDWVARTTYEEVAQMKSWQGSFSLGSPASVAGLVWSHAWGSRALGKAYLAGEGYVLALDQVYRENLLGIWFGVGQATLGFRHWQVWWTDFGRRAGWTGSGQAGFRRGRFEVRGAVQDVRLGRGQECAPQQRIGGAVRVRARAGLSFLIAMHRSRDRSGGWVGLRWSYSSLLCLYQEFSIPGGSLRTGLGVETVGKGFGLWFEPTSQLGWRLGLNSRFGR
jgi:hypothetical protein